MIRYLQSHLFLRVQSLSPFGLRVWSVRPKHTWQELVAAPTAAYVADSTLLTSLLLVDVQAAALAPAAAVSTASADKYTVAAIGMALYSKFLNLHGLVVDHHGWLYASAMAVSADVLRFRNSLLFDDARVAHALRLLTSARLMGFAYSGESVP